MLRNIVTDKSFDIIEILDFFAIAIWFNSFNIFTITLVVVVGVIQNHWGTIKFESVPR